MMSVTERSEDALSSDHFAAALPRKQFLRVDEVADAIGMSPSFIFKLLDAGVLHGVRHNAATGAKARWRIHRDSVILYLLERADYEPSDFIERAVKLIRGRSNSEVEAIREALK